MGILSGGTDNEAIRDLREEIKKLRQETTKASKIMFWLTFFLIILTIVLAFQGFK